MAVSGVEAPTLVEPPKIARGVASTMTANASDSLSKLSVRSINPDLERSFYRRFPKTRESYDRRKEQEVITMISQSKGWKCVGKPCFRRDASTGIVFRKAPLRRQHLTRHITACVPYELSFNVATLEHLTAHVLLSRGERPDTVDSAIAAKYTGVDRDHLRYIRKYCSDCNPNVETAFRISVDCPQMVHELTKAAYVLRAWSHPSRPSPPMIPEPEEGLVVDNGIASDDLSSATRFRNIFWIFVEDEMAESLSTQVIKHRCVAAANSALLPSCFLPLRAAELLRVLGPAFVSLDREHVTAHQSVVTASVLEDDTRCQVNYQTASCLQRQLAHNSSFLDPKTIFMLAWRRHVLGHTVLLQDIYTRVELHGPEIARVFPCRSELQHAHGKIGDIWALDLVAQHAPLDWSFRPITCDCTSECRLGKVGVLKRTHSCGSEHVILRPTPSDLSRNLRCLARQRRTSKRKAAHSMERWFHQEFIEGLRQIGEFRVFIVTVSDARSTRGRRGKVIEVVHTLELKDRELVVTVLNSSSIWPGKLDAYSKIDLQELRKFALYVFEALRSRPDWSTNFESLEVGARVDVGIKTIDGSCRFFVNEVTRIYEADFFAEWLAQPGTHVCRAVSAAIGEVFMDLSNSY